MIRESKPVSMAEALEYVKDSEEGSETDVKGFIKKFVKITSAKAKDLRAKIEELDLMKVKEEHLVKIIDLLPETPDELNKIFVEVSLDEEESKKILDIVKEFK
jgi:DNA-directed RNA polymerase subunit F